MKTNVINWLMDKLEKGAIDENQVIVVYDKNNNIEYLGKAQFAPLSLWEEFKTAVQVGNELRINERQVEEPEKTNDFYKKPFMLKIVGLNCDTVFYQVKMHGKWVQFTKSAGKFIHMMYVLFPSIMRKCDKYNFDNQYSVANWLYNYGEEIKPCETYIFYEKR